MVSCGQESVRVSKYVINNRDSHSMPGISFAGLIEEVLEKKVPFRFTASGLSMSPFIRDGDVITIAPSSSYDLKRGDVVAFINPSTNLLTVHRILLFSKSGYLIKGDNTSKPDGQVLASDIIGQVVRVEHSGRNMRFGLGVERNAIAFLSHRGWLTPNIWKVWRDIKPFAEKWIINKRRSIL